MHISKTIAMRIVTELGAIIDQRINLMDESGTIIASTDPSRIGTLHGGAQKVVRERLPELFIAADGEYPGSRAGLNLPIEMDGKIIGVVGITGEYAAIEKHGLVIKKMTEILLLDNLPESGISVFSMIAWNFSIIMQFLSLLKDTNFWVILGGPARPAPPFDGLSIARIGNIFNGFLEHFSSLEILPNRSSKSCEIR